MLLDRRRGRREQVECRATRFQYTIHLIERAAEICEVFQYKIRYDEVEHPVGSFPFARYA